MINMKDLIKKQGDMIRKESGMNINEAVSLKDAGDSIFDIIIAFKQIYEKSPHKKNRKINMYIKQLLKIEQQLSNVVGDLD